MTSAKNEKLNSELFEITTGILLGDANLQKPSGCHSYRLRFAQNSMRKDYVFDLFDKYSSKNALISEFSSKSQPYLTNIAFKSMVSTTDFDNSSMLMPCKPLVSKAQPRLYTYTTRVNKLIKQSYGFETRLCSAFDMHAQWFYSAGSSKKNLCDDLSIFYELITPKALAYWYMDDGTWPNKNANTVILCTHAYSVTQVTYLAKILQEKFNLYTTVKFNKKQPTIQISAKSYTQLKILIYPILVKIPSMKNKFPF